MPHVFFGTPSQVCLFGRRQILYVRKGTSVLGIFALAPPWAAPQAMSMATRHIIDELIQTRHEGSTVLLAQVASRPEIPTRLRSVRVDQALPGSQIEEAAGDHVAISLRIAPLEPFYNVTEFGM